MALISEACRASTGTADAMGVSGKHVPCLQTISAQKWKEPHRRERASNLSMQKVSAGTMWASRVGLSGSATAEGHLRAAPTLKWTRATREATMLTPSKFVSISRGSGKVVTLTGSWWLVRVGPEV